MFTPSKIPIVKIEELDSRLEQLLNFDRAKEGTRWISVGPPRFCRGGNCHAPGIVSLPDL